MENSTNQENIKQQPTDNKQHNIETVTPDTENVRPLSRQGSPEELNAANETSADLKKESDTADEGLKAEKKETGEENDKNSQDNNHEPLPVQDNSDNAKTTGSDEENTSTSAEQTDESDQGGEKTTAENKSGDPRDDIETVSP